MRKVDSEPAPNERYWAPQALDSEIERLDRRAKRNRRKARLATLTIVATSAIAPLALLASTKWQYFTLEKLIPGVLAACAALAAGFLQFERPREYWKHYRHWHMSLDAERLLYWNHAKPYDGDDRDVVLAEWLAACELRIDYEWGATMPTKDSDAAIAAKRAEGTTTEGA